MRLVISLLLACGLAAAQDQAAPAAPAEPAAAPAAAVTVPMVAVDLAPLAPADPDSPYASPRDGARHRFQALSPTCNPPVI